MQDEEMELTKTLPPTYISPAIGVKLAAAPKRKHFDLRDYNLIPYDYENLSLRYQGDCGNCWVWAGTTCLEVSLAEHLRQLRKPYPVRLSIQYFNSYFENPNNTGCWACCGQNAKVFADFYSNTRKVIPWDNIYAQFADSSRCCGHNCPRGKPYCFDDTTTRPPGAIRTDPHYKLYPVVAEAIPLDTAHNNTEEAIALIKNVLEQNRSIYLSMYFNGTQMAKFKKFWGGDAEELIWEDEVPVDNVSSSRHAVSVIGYDDTNPKDRYWIILNSWGRGNYLPRVPLPEKSYIRPHGTFRLSMDLDYFDNRYMWFTIDPKWT
jgi:hypothetical protein